MATKVFQIADDYVSAIADLDPITALQLGQPSGGLTDFSTVGSEKSVELGREYLSKLALVSDENPADRVARLVLEERIGARIAAHEAGEHLAQVNILFCPASEIRQVFEMLPVNSPEADAIWLKTIRAIPSALSGWKESLEVGIAKGVLAARRQALEVSDQCLEFAKGEFLVERAGQLGAEAEVAASNSAFAEMSQWLREVYAVAAPAADGVGEKRYQANARYWTGAELDLTELFAWGWADLIRIHERLSELATVICPGRGVEGLVEALDSDPKYRVQGEAAILQFLRELTDRATAEMAANHFHIPDEIRHCDVRIAPAGSASAAYYISPSEDFTRPGATWLPNVNQDLFNTWQLVSTWYHEAVPGHHLQAGTSLVSADKLSRFQRTLGWISGYGEGWALYAERLMAELGYFSDPGYEVGYLASQALRAARIVVDIGMHLGLAVPADVPGETAGALIDYDFSVEFLQRRALQSEVEAKSETIRYLGLPGQAISYKVGERAILAIRTAEQTQLGDRFDLKEWHAWLLGIGPVGLSLLYRLAAERRASLV